MSELRRRIGRALGRTPSPSLSRDQTPGPGEEVKLVPAKKLERLEQLTERGNQSKRRIGLIFLLGSVLGLVVAGFFTSQTVVRLDTLIDLVKLDSLLDVSLDSLVDVLPAAVLKEAQDIVKAQRDVINYDSFSVGLHLQSEGVKALHPVIMVPGVVSSGLESWSTDDASRPYFRKRVWASWFMLKALVLDQKNWKKHIMLDKYTGLDPPGIKLRAAQGFDATDFFLPGFWLWNKILENLATIGYDPTNAFTAAYDWRLSYMNLEKRDRYFTRLKSHIELALQISGHKPVIVSHSMGSPVFFFFLKWVEHPDHGAGGPNWVNDHIDSWINICGCLLGAPKSVPAFLSGEMKDTVQLNAFAVYGLEKFLSREDRAELFRAVPGGSSLLPKGGNAVWGNATFAPDDLASPAQNLTNGPFISFRPPDALNTTGVPQRENMTMEESIDYLLNVTEDWYVDQVRHSYSLGVAHTRAQVEANQDDPRTWLNPLEARLPLAPNMKIYCFYGIGKPTERAYFYTPVPPTYINPSSSVTLNMTIDAAMSTPPHTAPGRIVDHGVIFGDGDGTVNLLSTGYMCAQGWQKINRYNPAGIKVTTYEMPHEPDRFSPRGGPNSGDHVNILGRSNLNDLILRIAGGKGDDIEENYESRIWEIGERVQIRNEEP
ncbi:hypothetical protein DV736_g3419, partial [Chaetothyriales sp. CBS 134916]